MQEKGIRTVSELLAAYPNISVCRDRLGCMIVFIGEGLNPQKRLYLSLGRDSSSETKLHLTIAIPPAVKEGKYSYIKVFPVPQGGARVEKEGLLDEEDSREIVERAKQGLELFQAAGTARSEVNVPAARVYDWMQVGDEPLLNKLVIAEHTIVEKAGLSGEEAREALKYAHPSENYLYMLGLLDSLVS